MNEGEVVLIEDDDFDEPSTSESSHRKQLAAKLSKVSKELAEIDAELAILRQRKSSLLITKQSILSQIEASTVNYQDNEDKWDRGTFPWSSKAKEILTEVFHLKAFRPLQRATINAVLSREDCICIMSTGSGKSLCYQLPAVLSKGLTLVVSPLISLMEDQLYQLRKLDIRAIALHQNTTKDEIKIVDVALTDPKCPLQLLYITPEKLAKSKKIMNKLEKAAHNKVLKLIAIDEVHCCSQWGHDFRPDYKFLNVLKRQFKGVPILGLTATATGTVLEDVKKMLGIETAIVFRAGFNRPNLQYEVVQKDKGEMGEGIAEIIKKRFRAQSGIVYCFSRKDCEIVAQNLRANGVAAAFYHAHMETAEKTAVHEKWLSGRYQVIVATVAFGMGIDKPDVRFVVHHSMPKSVESYYQESGRAGRDGHESTCILMYRLSDLFKQSTMVCTEKTGIEKLYQILRMAVEDGTCRRQSLAVYFGEDWEEGWCQKACDVCKASREPLGEVDISSEATLAVDIIQSSLSDAHSSEGTAGRLTAAKLIDLIARRSRRSRAFLEDIIAHLLLSSILSEDFHFTPYSIVSYVVVGRGYAEWKNKGKPILRRIKESPVVKAIKRKMEGG